MINQSTKISELIKANPLVIDALAEFNPHFKKLRNPILRNLLARRVNIADACKIGGCQVRDFLAKMATIGFEIEGSTELPPPIVQDDIKFEEATLDLKVVELDVRPVLANGEDPLKLILKMCKELDDGECLKVINSFEPLPLIKLLNKHGYQSRTERSAPDIVYTWFIPGVKTRAGSLDDPESNIGLEANKEFDKMLKRFGPGMLHTIDVTKLEMPLPMINILEYLPKIMQDQALYVYHKKVPVYLLPELEERGFKYFIRQPKEGKVDLLICKA
jgi:hypothetical protein